MHDVNWSKLNRSNLIPLAVRTFSLGLWKMIKVPPQIMTTYYRITNERPAYILPLVNYSVSWPLISYSNVIFIFSVLLSKGKDTPAILDHLENPEHHPFVIGCVSLTPKNIRLSNIQHTTSYLIVRPFTGGPNHVW